jgi:hypothetical protein
MWRLKNFKKILIENESLICFKLIIVRGVYHNSVKIGRGIENKFEVQDVI